MPTAIHAELCGVIKDCGLSEIGALNLLQSDGVISDNCVTLEDIATRDCQNAIEYLKMIHPKREGSTSTS